MQTLIKKARWLYSSQSRFQSKDNDKGVNLSRRNSNIECLFIKEQNFIIHEAKIDRTAREIEKYIILVRNKNTRLSTNRQPVRIYKI